MFTGRKVRAVNLYPFPRPNRVDNQGVGHKVNRGRTRREYINLLMT